MALELARLLTEHKAQLNPQTNESHYTPLALGSSFVLHSLCMYFEILTSSPPVRFGAVEWLWHA